MEGYRMQAGFWKKTTPRVMGDFIARPRAVDMLGYVSRKKILEAGCGSGYVARMIAKKGAIVSGCDISQQMIEKAIEEESANPLGISYHKTNITRMGKKEEFDGISCVGVLMHNDLETISKFYAEADRVLKKDGVLVVSFTHPFMYVPGSPARKEGPNWMKLTPKENKPYNESQRMREDYWDVDGNVFVSEVWHHSLADYLLTIEESPFKIVDIQEPVVEKEHLLHPTWGTEYGYPAYLQFRMVKK